MRFVYIILDIYALNAIKVDDLNMEKNWILKEEEKM